MKVLVQSLSKEGRKERRAGGRLIRQSGEFFKLWLITTRRESSLGQKQKIVHSQESLWRNKNLLRGKKKPLNFSCLQESFASQSYTMHLVIHILKSFQKQCWTQASLRQARNPHWKAFKCQTKIQAWSSWGILDQWAPGKGGLRTRTVKAASLHRAASMGQRGPKEMVAGMKETSFCHQWTL